MERLGLFSLVLGSVPRSNSKDLTYCFKNNQKHPMKEIHASVNLSSLSH